MRPIRLAGAMLATWLVAGAVASPARAGGAEGSLPPPIVKRVRGPSALPPAAAVEKATLPNEGATRFVRTAGDAPPPPPPPSAPNTAAPAWSTAAPVPAMSAPMTTPPSYAAPCAVAPAVPLAARCWSGCRLPCEDGISMWHARAVFGYALYSGTDAPSHCGYWGVDLGRTFCGCWGLDGFFRMNSGRFDRQDPLFGLREDGGYFYHVGAKFTWQRSFHNNSRFYYWLGVGPEYFWTGDYLTKDSGLGAYGEIGFGYLVTQNVRLTLGLDVHADHTDVTRFDPANDGQKRWIFTFAPNLGVEVDF